MRDGLTELTAPREDALSRSVANNIAISILFLS